VSGIAILFTTFVFAELSTKIPKSGSSYRYAYVIGGEYQAWLVGWNCFMQYGILASCQGVAFSNYLVSFIKYNGSIDYVPTWLIDLKIGNRDVSPLAALFAIMMTYIATLGTQKSANYNNFFTAT
jgi:APA family basic amino acid/polyamine antiporter